MEAPGNGLLQGLKKNCLKISKNVRNPSNNVGKSLVNLRQPSIIFGNLRVIFANLRKSSDDFRKYSVTFENCRVIFGNLRKCSDDLRQSSEVFGRSSTSHNNNNNNNNNSNNDSNPRSTSHIHLTLKRLFSAVASPATEFEVSAWKHSKT